MLVTTSKGGSQSGSNAAIRQPVDGGSCRADDGCRGGTSRCGFLSGRWAFDDSGNGRFRGVWYDRAGLAVGYLKGHFGQRKDGENVFFGKWVSREGRFKGFIKGHWVFNEISLTAGTPDQAGNYFRGQIFSENRIQIGFLAGRFIAAGSENNSMGGFSRGRWKILCPAEDWNDTENNDGLNINFQ